MGPRGAGGERPRILVVDDEPGIREILHKVLSRAGYDVDTVDNGAAAVRMAERDEYRLVLMDLKMPEMKGPETIRRILDVRPGMKILVLTGHVPPVGTSEAPGEMDRLVTDGQHRCVFKPFRIDEVVSAIRSLLAAP